MDTKYKGNELARVLFGRTRGAVLALLFGHPDESFYLREIARRSGCGLGPVQRELKLLTNVRLIIRTPRGHQVYFQADAGSPVFAEMKNLVAKTADAGDILAQALKPMEGRISHAFIYGPLAAGGDSREGGIELFIIGSVPFSEVVWRLQDAQRSLGREIRPTVKTIEEFRAAARENDRFLASVLEGPRIHLIGGGSGLAG